MTPQTTTLYPTYAVQHLRAMKGKGWRRLIDRVARLPVVHPEAIAFTLMIRRLGALIGSKGRMFRMDVECVLDIVELLKRYEGTERDLLDEYRHTLVEVESFLNGQRKMARIAA